MRKYFHEIAKDEEISPADIKDYPITSEERREKLTAIANMKRNPPGIDCYLKYLLEEHEDSPEEYGFLKVSDYFVDYSYMLNDGRVYHFKKNSSSYSIVNSEKPRVVDLEQSYSRTRV